MATLMLAVSLMACGPKPEGGETPAPPATGQETPAAPPAGMETPAPAGTETPAPTGMETPAPAGSESPAAGGTGAAFEEAAKGLPGYDEVLGMKLEIPSTPEAIARGKELYAGAGTCASCHGDAGLGDGPAGVALEPKPRNMTEPGQYKWGADAKGIFRTTAFGGPTGSLMVAFSDKHGGALTEDQVKDLTAYVMSLQKK